MQSYTLALAAPRTARQSAPTPQCADPRWEVLNLVRRARHDLGLKDRDLAVLRGLLSLLPVGDWDKAMVVYGSNRTLAERCDGIEERTLRRRLTRLQEVGLIDRRLSPNGKRYALRDTSGDVLLAYGIDLAPLARLRDQLDALAQESEARAQDTRMAKALIRDRLYHITLEGRPIDTDLAETARLALRRNLSLETLEGLRVALEEVWIATTPTAETHPQTLILSGSDSKNDRHIQSHHTDYYDLNPDTDVEASPVSNDEPLSVTDCLDNAPSVAQLALERPQSWRDMVGLAQSLAPAIGVKARQWQTAQMTMGPINAALAILGLVEALGRIQKPQAYLARLIGQAQDGVLDATRMFKSLTRPKCVV